VISVVIIQINRTKNVRTKVECVRFWMSADKNAKARNRLLRRTDPVLVEVGWA
jgi:hypothetical protein